MQYNFSGWVNRYTEKGNARFTCKIVWKKRGELRSPLCAQFFRLFYAHGKLLNKRVFLVFFFWRPRVSLHKPFISYILKPKCIFFRSAQLMPHNPFPSFIFVFSIWNNTDHTGATIHILSKKSHIDNLKIPIFTTIYLSKISFFTNSPFWNLSFLQNSHF